MVGGGLLYYQLSTLTNQSLNSPVEAIYLVLALTFLQPLGDFPNAWYLQIFYFLMPIIGIGILAQGLTDFGIVLFNRRARSKEWEMAVASTFSNHIVLVGLGHLGFRVAKQLCELDQDVAAIEIKPEVDLVSRTQEMGIPVIQDDARREETLQAAGVAKARAILVCTQNDSLNLQIAFKARRLNPDIRVVLRIFDDEFARILEGQFGFRAMSATDMAKTPFAAAAAGIDITAPISVEGEALSLARLDIPSQSQLIGRSVAELEQRYQVSVVLLRHDHESDFHPAGERCLSAQDVLAVLGGAEQIGLLLDDNQ